MAEIEKMDLESKDLVAERIEQLKAMFPEIAVEGEGSIDFEKLRLILGDEVDEGQERYAFTWPGKADAIRQAQIPSTATLRPSPEDSVEWDTTENLYIEGDNLEVLKLLQRSYHGKVKMIYIDPPYNTGHDFVYKDSFQDSIANYKEQAGLSGQSNADTSGRYHSNWLSMMYPRLRLARELLADDGVIAISIKTQENGNLEKLLDEIFGEQNKVGCLTWESVTQPANAGSAKFGLQQKCEFIYLYSKAGRKRFVLDLAERDNSYPHQGKFGACRFEIIEKSDAGDYNRETMKFEILGKKPRPGKRWQIGLETARELEANGRLEIVDGIVKKAVYPEDEIDAVSVVPFWSHFDSLNAGTAQKGKEQLNTIMNEAVGFDTVKPIELLMQLLKKIESDALIIDFFSGTGSTAQAMWELNMQDNGKRTCILVQMPEAMTGAYKNLCQLAEERIRRAGQKIKHEIEEANAQLKLGEEPKQVPDLGFRVLKLDDSNFDKVAPGALMDNIVKAGRTNDDIIFEMMLKWGLELSLPMEKTEVAGYPITSIAADELICCMDEGLTVEVLEAIAALEPKRVFFLDSILTDTLKLNAAQIFKRIGDKLGMTIELRTV